MKLEKIDPEGSVLFLGSGFSVEATNIWGEHLPTGRGLREIFARIIGVDPNDYDLQTLADEVSADPHSDLYDLLYKIFTVKGLTNDQQEILKLPWLRVYTTNYDDAVEYAYSLKRRPISSFSYNDGKPRQLLKSSIIHLHGAIRTTTPKNVTDQLVLTEEAYVRQHFERSPWYDEFVRDIRFSTACFFVGYSLSDYHISALLLQDSSLRDRTFFITKKPDTIFTNRVKKYGHVLPVGISGFKDLCASLPRLNRLENPYDLKSFRYIDPFKDKKTLAPPTPIEVLNLVTYGTFNERRCMSSLPRPTYVAPRQELAKSGSDLLRQARTLLVHSRLGNGKSVFLSILAHKLSELQFKCFWCREVSPTLGQDARAISSVKNVVIIFDSYNVAIDVIDVIASDIPDAKFVIAIRTAVQEVRLHEIQKRVPRPCERVNLNGLDQSERKNFLELLDTAGVVARDLPKEIARCNDIREIVLSIYKNEKVREKLELELAPLYQDKAVRSIIITSHLLKWIGQEGNAAFLRVVTGKDAYAEAARFKEVAAEMFLFGDDDLKVHSAVFSEFLIENVFKAEHVIETIYFILVEAVSRKWERRYQTIISSLMKVSTLKRF